MDRIFKNKLQPKVINNQQLSAKELGRYFKKYTEIFKDKAVIPEAKTLLAATAEVNNINAYEKAFSVYNFNIIQIYKKNMEKIVNPKTPYIDRKKSLMESMRIKKEAIEEFKAIATIGSEEQIQEFNSKLDEEIERSFKMYDEINEQKDPLKTISGYLYPIYIIIITFVLSSIFSVVFMSDNNSVSMVLNKICSLCVIYIIGKAVYQNRALVKMIIDKYISNRDTDHYKTD